MSERRRRNKNFRGGLRIMETAKLLVLVGCRRCLELLADIEKDGVTKQNRTELSAKMKELRRDTVRLEELIGGTTIIGGAENE